MVDPGLKADREERIRRVIAYHERTKHHLDRSARSPGYLDWQNEPKPFRLFEGAPLLALPLGGEDPETAYPNLYERQRNPFRHFSFQNIAKFLELSLGLSAWKSYRGNTWALRINPSSGNLHPTEAHLILPPLPETDHRGGVFHYNPFLHALECRTSFDLVLWAALREHFGTDGFLVGLTSIYWREAWKYGERAFRYCNHDVGHALACLSFSGNLLGWKVTYLNALSDEELEGMLGFHQVPWRRFERENPETLLFVHASKEQSIPRDIPSSIIESFSSLTYGGDPNVLSDDHADWAVIDEVSLMSQKQKAEARTYPYENLEYSEQEAALTKGAAIIRQRRSAQAYDGTTSIPKRTLFSMLDKTIPRNHRAPFDVELGEISVHLLLFVHRVRGIESGLYFLLRDGSALEEMKGTCGTFLLWERVTDAPMTVPLYLLQKGDFRSRAATVSCYQEIAGDSSFSLGMVAKFRENIEKDPFLYRRLFWETGMIGQVLYLEAEAHGVRGTGIGCFFDDPVHEVLGLSDNTFQSLYHFTVGGPVEDGRLAILPPYHHLKRERS